MCLDALESTIYDLSKLGSATRAFIMVPIGLITIVRREQRL
jgi:NifB/MoaA-like Fe-S oxidoreductase